ncbi:hypothetical protein PMAYCL1PPCAC_29464, partial [Pristionchus mayeri]
MDNPAASTVNSISPSHFVYSYAIRSFLLLPSLHSILFSIRSLNLSPSREHVNSLRISTQSIFIRIIHSSLLFIIEVLFLLVISLYDRNFFSSSSPLFP